MLLLKTSFRCKCISPESRAHRTTSPCLIGTPLTSTKRLKGKEFSFGPLNDTDVKLMKQHKLENLRCVPPEDLFLKLKLKQTSWKLKRNVQFISLVTVTMVNIYGWYKTDWLLRKIRVRREMVLETSFNKWNYSAVNSYANTTQSNFQAETLLLEFESFNFKDHPGW